MANQRLEVSDDLLAYVRRVSLREDGVLRELREVTAEMPAGSTMLVMPEEGQLLTLLTALCGARKVVELGTFTGYGSLCLARALPADGRLHTCDISGRWAGIAVHHWKRAEVSDRIDFRTVDANTMIADLLAEFGPGSIDLSFIDADKAGYVGYYEGLLRLTRPGGLIVIDNSLFFGRVIDPADESPDTRAVRALNELLHDDDRVDVVLLPMADGITLARKK